MENELTLSSVYAPSEDIVARDIEGEIIIVPLAAGIGGTEDELFTLNPTGRAIWDQLDGQRSVGEIISALSAEYDSNSGQVEVDVQGFLSELLRRKMIVPAA